MLNVQIVLFDGFDLLDAVAPYEVFCAAGIASGGAVQAAFVAAEGPRSVASGVGGVKLEAGGRLDAKRQGIIVLPGAAGKTEGDGPDAIPALLARAASPEMTAMLAQALEDPAIIVAAVCGGSLIPAMGGLLEGRHAVTHHLGMPLLGAAGAVPVPARVVDDGNLVTGGGVTSGLDVALHLVERELGPRIAHAVERLFEFERRGTVWRHEGLVPVPGTLATAVGGEGGEIDETEETEARPDAIATGSGVAVFEGDWETVIATPVGQLAVRLRIDTAEGDVRGTATQGDETAMMLDPEASGNRLRWSLRVKKPMRLNLKFDVIVEGDRMTGTAKAGLLPASRLTGHRP